MVETTALAIQNRAYYSAKIQRVRIECAVTLLLLRGVAALRGRPRKFKDILGRGQQHLHLEIELWPPRNKN